MKRIVSMALILLAMAVLLTGCGANPVGSYVTKTVDGQPVEAYIESMGATPELLEIASAEELMTLEIRADGTFTAKMSGSDPKEGTWTQDGNKLSMTVDGATEEFTLSGDEIAYKTDNQDIVFAKKSTN